MAITRQSEGWGAMAFGLDSSSHRKKTQLSGFFFLARANESTTRHVDVVPPNPEHFKWGEGHRPCSGTPLQTSETFQGKSWAPSRQAGRQLTVPLLCKGRCASTQKSQPCTKTDLSPLYTIITLQCTTKEERFLKMRLIKEAVNPNGD